MPRISSFDIPRLIESGLDALRNQQEEINKLNVFPVPDGDTGTNLVMTMQAMSEELAKSSELSMDFLTKGLAFASLMGARGNAGVILSQIVRGMCEVLGASEIISTSDIIAALQNGVEVAYQAVRKPVEGTMLTVLKDAAATAKSLARKNLDIDMFIEQVLQEANRSLERTPDLLPVLKEAGVVDAGGYGLVVIGQGILAALRGQEYVETQASLTPSLSQEEEISLEFTYCTEFILKGKEINMDLLQKELEKLGDSVMVVGSSDLMRVHIHSNSPGKVLENALKDGSISQVRINNMEEQAEERSRKLVVTPKKDVEIVAVASGQGIKNILTSLGVGKVIDGGQGMNPSTAEILEGIEDGSAGKVIILPNNKNIVLAARTAAKTSKKEAEVIPTNSVIEAFSALLAYDPEKPIETNIKLMEEATKDVKTGEITQAVRNSESKAGRIKKNDYIGLFDHEVKVIGKSLIGTTKKLIKKMLSEADEVITLLSGAGVSKEESEAIIKEISESYPDLEIELHTGGQPLYHLVIGIE